MFAVVFPGQGAQSVGMAGDFQERFAVSRQAFEEASDATGLPLGRIVAEGPESELRRTEITQPAILTASIAIYRALEPTLPQPPVAFAGHSLGEYSALVAAGALSLGDAARLVRRRGALMQEAVPEGEGEMAAILGPASDEVARVCAGIAGAVAPANFNAPTQTVIAGASAAVQAACEALRAAGARVMKLDVSAPFHCELMRSAMEKLAPLLAETAFRDCRIPVISNVSAAAYSQAAEAKALLRDQVCAPVRWVECVQGLVGRGARVQLEVGPGKVLSGLAGRIDKGLGRANVASVADLDAARAALVQVPA
jgi:[acyl-carrier-protein] S-malonyltransferase